MTRAGEKLYGGWNLDEPREGLFSSRRFWIGFGLTIGAMIVGAVLAVALR